MNENKLIIYPAPKGLAENNDFSVRVRVPGGEWEDVFTYLVKVDMHEVRQASMCIFDFFGTIEIEVSCNKTRIDTVCIRPLSYEVDFEHDEKLIRFTLDKPRKLSIEVNGDRFHNLHLFAGEIDGSAPDLEAENVLRIKPGIHRPTDLIKALTLGDQYDTVYFSQGLHYIEELIFKIPSNKKIYIAGGAAVVGSFVCDTVENVSVEGRGLIYLMNFERFAAFRGFRVIFSKNISISGVAVINPSHYSVFAGQSQGLKIKDFKSFSCEGWSDGIDCMSCSDIEIEDIFMRNSDDCIAIYGRRWEFNGDSRNISVKNSVLWADVAHPINIGIHGDYHNDGNTIENLVFENIDILEHHERQYNYKGCMTINAGDKNTVRNVHFENIRIEQFEEGRLIDLRVVKNSDYNPAPGKKIENISFKDIYYNGTGEFPSLILGYDEERVVDGVTIENLQINGTKVMSEKDMEITIGNHSKNVRFR